MENAGTKAKYISNIILYEYNIFVMSTITKININFANLIKYLIDHLISNYSTTSSLSSTP